MKNYLCKDCPYNNNGWCTQLKKQGLKDITICSIKPGQPNSSSLQNSPKAPAHEPIHDQLIGKTEILHSLLKVLAIEKKKGSNEKEMLDALSLQLLGLTEVTQQHIKLHKVRENAESIIDLDLIDSLQELKEYIKK